MIMKRVLFFAIMMMAVATAKAQFAPGTFSIQPKIGFTISWLSNAPKLPYGYEGKYSLDKTAAGGIIIGADAEYMVNDIFAVEAGINYSMQGSQWEDETWHEGDWRYDINDTKIELGYVNIPVTAKVYVWRGLAVKAGVQMGLLTNAKFKSKLHVRQEGSSTVSTTPTSEKIRSDCEKMDLSIPIGVSYEFSNHIVVDARYNWGLTKINKEKDFGDKNMKNSVFLITCGYKFKL